MGNLWTKSVEQAPSPSAGPGPIAALHELIETCKGGARSFELAAQNIRDGETEEIFKEHAQRYAEFAAELQHHVRRLGRDPEKAGSVSEALRRGWLNIRAAMTIEEGATGEMYPKLYPTFIS
jgi:uncharacterized protein (TIGR02284 family)